MIAAGLNRDKIPSPFGGEWAASTINGNLKRRSEGAAGDSPHV
jgi:site-specific DNA recombinase